MASTTMAAISAPVAQLTRPTLSRRTNAVRSRVPVAAPAFRRSARCEANPLDKAQSAAKEVAADVKSKLSDAASKLPVPNPSDVDAESTIRKVGSQTSNAFSGNMIPKPGQSQSTDLLTYEGLLERINGRAAMLGFLAALAGESITGKSIASQMTLFPISKYAFLLVAGLTIVSSLVPPSKGVGDAEFEKQSFWRPGREIINGRTAMLGFIAMLATEAITGQTTLGFWLS
eukprot:jgi/Chlat1/5794/Chrsp387S05519